MRILAIIILFLLSHVSSSYADLRMLQSKYAGANIAGKLLSSDDVSFIYNGLPSIHPFHQFDRLMQLPNAGEQLLMEMGSSCKKQYFGFNYKCNKSPGFIEFNTSGKRVTEYKATADLKNMLLPILGELAKSLGTSTNKSFNQMMTDFVLTKFNDVAPSHVKYEMDGHWIIISGKPS